MLTCRFLSTTGWALQIFVFSRKTTLVKSRDHTKYKIPAMIVSSRNSTGILKGHVSKRGYFLESWVITWVVLAIFQSSFFKYSQWSLIWKGNLLRPEKKRLSANVTPRTFIRSQRLCSRPYPRIGMLWHSRAFVIPSRRHHWKAIDEQYVQGNVLWVIWAQRLGWSRI
jgi:hypothetical protein